MFMFYFSVYFGWNKCVLRLSSFTFPVLSGSSDDNDDDNDVMSTTRQHELNVITYNGIFRLTSYWEASVCSAHSIIHYSAISPVAVSFCIRHRTRVIIAVEARSKLPITELACPYIADWNSVKMHVTYANSEGRRGSGIFSYWSAVKRAL